MSKSTVVEGPPEFPRVYDGIDALTGALGINNPSTVNGSYASCGLTMLSGLSVQSPADIVQKVLIERSPFDRKQIREAFVLFSDTDYDGKTGGNALFAYIVANKLGQITEFGPRMNPNTGNQIKLWVWAPPHASLEPRYKHMPVYGKTQRMDSMGHFSGYDDTPVPPTVGREA